MKCEKRDCRVICPLTGRCFSPVANAAMSVLTDKGGRSRIRTWSSVCPTGDFQYIHDSPRHYRLDNLRGLLFVQTWALMDLTSIAPDEYLTPLHKV